MRQMLAVLGSVFSMLLLAGALGADVLHLENGGTIEGIVKEDGSFYQVQTVTGTCTIAKDQVLLRELKEYVLDKYNKAAAAVKADDAQGHFELAMLCKDGKWSSKMKDELLKVIEIDPEHEQARAELGYVKHDGKWITYDEMMKAKGYVRFEDKWVTQEYIKQVDDWKKTVRTIKKQEDKINSALIRMSSNKAAMREKAVNEFIVAAKDAGIVNAAEVGKQIKDYYDEAWRVIAEIERDNVLGEVRATDARLVQLGGLQTFLGQGGGVTVVRRIETPEMNVTSIKTTVLCPGGVRIRLHYPSRPEFRE